MKRNLKNLLVAVAFLATSAAIIVACSDSSDGTEETTNNVQFNAKSTPAYMNQMPFVMGGDSETDGHFDLDNNLMISMENPSVSWTYFDNLYNSSLKTSVKQRLSYIILVKKDLIGLVDANPSNTTLVTALKKHVDNLVGSSYIGYTSLYYALDALNRVSGQTSYVDAKAAQIVSYAANDPFHPDMIQAGPTEIGQDLHDKLVANYAYVTQISAL